MSAGDGLTTCPWCHQSYYIQNGHDCKVKLPVTFQEYSTSIPSWYSPELARINEKLDKIIKLLGGE